MKRIFTLILILISSLNLTAQSFDNFMKVVASDRAGAAAYGWDVAIDGEWAVVGAPFEERNSAGGYVGFAAGGAYIYNFNSITGLWSETQKISASDISFIGQFGISVAISGNYMVIGSNGNNSQQGAAYVFENIAGTWSQMQKITSTDGTGGDNFGISVGIDGTRIIVGAYFEEEDASGVSNLTGAGSAYIFDLVGPNWTQTQKLVASDRGANDEFGYSVDVSGNYAIVGAHFEDHNASGGAAMADAGSAYIYQLVAGTWSQQNKIVASDRSGNSKFGESVKIDGIRAFIGSYNDDLDASGANFVSNAGSVYNFNLFGASWLQNQKIVAGDRHNTAHFGFDMDVEGDYLVIGAQTETYDANVSSSLPQAGAAYIYKVAPSTLWSQVQKIDAFNRETGDYFGQSVGITDTTVLVGAPYEKEDENNTNRISSSPGSAYFFKPPPLPNVTISGIINDYAAVSVVDHCQNQLTLDDASAFSVGDSILIIQMKGAEMDLTNTASFGDAVNLNAAGNYEYNVITSIVGNVMTFQNGFQYAFDAAGAVQVVSIPNYISNVVVAGGLTAMPWDGSKGGILIFNVSGTLSLTTDIDVSGLGFRGGYNDNSITQIPWGYFLTGLAVNQKYHYPLVSDTAAQKGESVVEFLPGFESGRGKSINGGGGANKAEAGGGGGASRANGGNGGVSDHTGGSSQFLDRGLYPGIGGDAIIDPTRLFLGGAGGAGDGNNGNYYGGNGGGIIMINAGSIEGNTHSILANGTNGDDGNSDGGSGGGAGGSIYLNSGVTTPASNLIISAIGGDGGNANDTGSSYCHGPGGGGSGGEIRTSITTNLTTDVSGGIPGVVVGSSIACNGSTKGATAGSNGAFVNANGPSLFGLGSPFVGLSSIIISNLPDTVTLCENFSLNIAIDTAGNATPVSFQWQLMSSGSSVWTDLTDVAPYDGAMTDTLTISNIPYSLNGNLYRVLVYHPCDSVYSDSINLQVNRVAVVNEQPEDTTVCIGNDGAFVMDASNVVTYRWQNNEGGSFANLSNNATYAGVTTDSLFINNVAGTLSGVDFRLRMVDECGNVSFSNLVNVIPTSLITITDLATDISICENEDSLMYVTTSFEATSYTWQIQSGSVYTDLNNGLNYNNVDNDTLNLNNIPFSFDGNIYRVVVTDACSTTLNSNDIMLTVFENSASTVNDTICANETYTLPDGGTTSLAGVYTDTLSNTNGCDSVVTTNLVVNAVSASTVNDTICSNEMYTLPDGMMVNTAGTYLDTLQNVNTCDSVITTNLVVNPTDASTVNDTICSNEMYTLPDGVIVSMTGTYTDTLQNVNGCDSVITTNLVVNATDASTVNDTICSNEMYTLPAGSMVNTAGTYTDTVQNVNGCDSVVTTNLVVNATDASTVNDTICFNEMYTLPDATMVNMSGTYMDTLQNVNGCDSVVTTELVVTPASAGTANDTICSNEMYTLPDGSMVNTAGTYIDTVSVVGACDSIITTNLVVNATDATSVNDTICSNEMYTLPDGSMVNMNGTYIDTLANENGCDSVITTNLVVNPTDATTVNDTICSNEMYTLPDGSMVGVAGTYIDTLQNGNGCDSVITTNLEVNSFVSTTVNDTICSNEMYTLPDGSMVNTASSYVDTLMNMAGCDSIITTNLTVNPTDATTVNDTICSNEMYTLPDGNMVNATGTYVDTLQNLNSCDSVITTNLVVNPTDASTVNDTICSNEMHTLPDGAMINIAGTYTDTLQNLNGCDSVITTNLVVNPTVASTVNDTICSNEMYTLPAGSMVNMAGTYSDTLQNVNGCDSVITTNLVVNPTDATTINDTICSNEMYTLPGGSMVNMTGAYLDTLQNLNGCDSVITTNLVVNPTDATTVNDTICSNEMYTLPAGSMVSMAGTYSDTLQNLNGCDSVITTNLVVNPTDASTVNDTICSNEMYTLPDGAMINTAGTYIDTLQNLNGCDSVITTNLVVNPTVASTVNDTICSNEMYTLPAGSMVNMAGTYSDTLQNVNGCDSVITTNLVVNPTDATTINDTICSNEMYTLPGGSMVNMTGAYLDTLQNLNGCDSVITTNLVVHPTDATTVNDTICSNEMYTLPAGSMVNMAGTYSDTLQNVNGCDSVITTNLVVNPTDASTVNDTICSNEMYTLPAGSMVNTAGTYTDTLQNVNGCDSVITTNLVVNPTDATTVNDTICSNEMYTLPAGSMVNMAGTYSDTLQNVNGCDSVITTNLVVNPTDATTVNDTICSNEMYTLPAGSMVNIAGTYSDTLQNLNGCDSVITTNLVVNPTNATTVNDTICAADMYTLPGGSMVNTAGMYLDTLQNMNGCDSVITTNLVVQPNINMSNQPIDVTVCEDSSALFYVMATGTDVVYQWQVDNGLGFVDIPGEVNDSLVIPNASAPVNLDGLAFRVILNSYCGNSINSDSAVLNVDFNVVLNNNPINAVICEGEDTSYVVSTNGNETNVQWQVDNGSGYVNLVDGVNYAGSSSLNLSIINTPLSFDGNNYRVIVSDNCGVIDTSLVASLDVDPLAIITTQPVSVDDCLGNDVTYFVTATNATSYQWQVNTGAGFTDMLGEVNDTLNLTAISNAMEGNQYQCIVSNNCNSLTTTVVDLVVSEVAVINSEPNDVVICPEGPGFNFDLTFDVENVNNFQWQIDTGLGFQDLSDVANFSGTNTNSLLVSIPFENVDGANFRVVYIDDCGFGAVSNEYNVRISEPNPVNGIDDVTFCQREIELIEVDYDGQNYVWDDAASTTGRFFLPEESGEYVVSFLQNSSSCIATDTIVVTLEDCVANCVVTAPTGFSPDASGMNDGFKAIYTCDLDYFELMIVNRWGEVLFFSTDPTEAWDGTFKNKPVPIDTYAWYIKYNKQGESNQQSVSGNVTLIR